MCRTARTKQEKNSRRDFILIKAVTGFPAQPGQIAAAWAVHRGVKPQKTSSFTKHHLPGQPESRRYVRAVYKICRIGRNDGPSTVDRHCQKIQGNFSRYDISAFTLPG